MVEAYECACQELELSGSRTDQRTELVAQKIDRRRRSKPILNLFASGRFTNLAFASITRHWNLPSAATLYGVVGGVGMELSDEFRTRGQRCLALAGAAPTLEAHAHWLSMAQLWHALAQYAEDQDQLFLSDVAAAIVGCPRATDKNVAE